MTRYVGAEVVRQVAAQVAAAGQMLPRTGFPQDHRGEAALRARALAEVLEAVADAVKAAGLTDGGEVPADVEMLSQLRHLADQTVSSLVLGNEG